TEVAVPVVVLVVTLTVVDRMSAGPTEATEQIDLGDVLGVQEDERIQREPGLASSIAVVIAATCEIEVTFDRRLWKRSEAEAEASHGHPRIVIAAFPHHEP